jgi:predicted RNA-binding Zn-ribbon protein involved in translation (DUF1610 family)
MNREEKKSKYFCSTCRREVDDPHKDVNGKVIIFRCPLCGEEVGRRMK